MPGGQGVDNLQAVFFRRQHCKAREGSAVTLLATGKGKEHCLFETHRIPLDRGDPRLQLGSIRVLPEELVRRHGLPPSLSRLMAKS
ncbi:hypothetical protein D3C76_1680610 [compost metagenome]